MSLTRSLSYVPPNSQDKDEKQLERRDLLRLYSDSEKSRQVLTRGTEILPYELKILTKVTLKVYVSFLIKVSVISKDSYF